MSFINNIAKRSEEDRVSEEDKKFITELYDIQNQNSDSSVMKSCMSLRSVLTGEKEFIKDAITKDAIGIFKQNGIEISIELLRRLGLTKELKRRERVDKNQHMLSQIADWGINLEIERTPSLRSSITLKEMPGGDFWLFFKMDDNFQEMLAEFKKFPDVKFLSKTKAWRAEASIARHVGIWARKSNWFKNVQFDLRDLR